MLIAAAPCQTIGSAYGARLRFGEEAKADGTWRGRRLLWLDEAPAFELSFWCGTCPSLFQRLEGSASTCSISGIEQRLAGGLQDIDSAVIAQFAELLPRGEYLPLLMGIQPRLVRPSQPGDYFAEEQVATWGMNAFWDLPENPRTPYYRTFETVVDRDSHLFEFVVPMVPPSWNDPGRVAEYTARLAGPSAMTTVAVGVLDICQPAVDSAADYFGHWSLTHFLLDGHHKMQAAADSGQQVRLLSLLSVDASLALPEQVAQIPELRASAQASRPTR